jgi:hypothetical protein
MSRSRVKLLRLARDHGPWVAAGAALPCCGMALIFLPGWALRLLAPGVWP